MNAKTALFSAAAAIAVGVAALPAGATTVAQSAQSFSADTLVVENFIGRIEFRESAGSDISVQVSNPGDVSDDPSVSGSGDRVRVDGGHSMRNLNCNTRNGNMRIGRRWGSRHDLSEYPTLIVTAPAGLDLTIDDSAFIAEAGDLGRLDLSMNSCGRFEAGRVSGEAGIGINGSGDVVIASVGGEGRIGINGSGDVDVGDIGGAGSISINGSGDVVTGAFNGPLDISINGSGDVEVASTLGLDIGINGSGDITVGELNGRFDASIGGSGDIRVDRGRAEPFDVSIRGSGDVRFGGTAVNVTVRESGGGDVHIEEIEGSVDWRRNGRTVLRVGDVD